MGLFSNDKKPCPICGEATPRLLATHIADRIPICSDCSAKISLISSQVGALSVEGLKAHLAQREENRKILTDTFRPNKKLSIGWTTLNIDEANRMFTLPLNMCGDTKNPPVFKFDELIGYEVIEESYIIERFSQGDMAPQYTPMMNAPIIQINTGNQEEKNETISRSFKINLFLTNSCWDRIETSAGIASGNRLNFQREYSKQLGEIHTVTAILAYIMGAGGARGANQSHGGQSDASDIANDIKKFKELLDGGIITQEEFNAKKKQLLGI